MMQKLSIITVLLLPAFYFSQKAELREDIKLKSFDYKIYIQNKKDKETDQELYLIPNKGDTIRENALVKKNIRGRNSQRHLQNQQHRNSFCGYRSYHRKNQP